MSTIAEKLNYLNDTRLKIKDGLNKFGAELTENDTFRSYSNVLNDIYNKLPKVSGNGSNFTLETVQNGKLDLFEMEGNTEQDSYSGINLLDTNNINVPSQFTNLTVISNEIGEITINGSSFTGNLNLKTNLSTPLNGTYSLIFKKLSGSISRNDVNFRFAIGNEENSGAASIPGRLLSSIFNNNSDVVVATGTINDTLDKFNMYFNPNAIFTNFKFVIYLVEGTYTSENIPNFEPYVGGTPSPNPDYPQEIEVVENKQNINVSGKNKFNINQITEGYYYTDDGTLTQSSLYNTSDFIKKEKNKIIVSAKVTSMTYIRYVIAEFDENKNFISRQLNSNTDSLIAEFTLNSNTKFYRLCYRPINLYDIQIEEVDTNVTEPSLYEPYHNKDYEIDLENIELCKIGDYQDYIYKENNKWYKHSEIGKLNVDTSTITIRSNYTNIEYAEITKPNDFIGKGNYNDYNVYCSHAVSDIKNAIQYAWDSTYRIGKITNKANAGNFWLGFPKGTGLDNIKTALNGAVIYYVLSTPTYEPITNSTLINQLEAIETETGTNIFEVSNENDVLPSLNVKRLKELEKLS